MANFNDLLVAHKKVGFSEKGRNVNTKWFSGGKFAKELEKTIDLIDGKWMVQQKVGERRLVRLALSHLIIARRCRLFHCAKFGRTPYVNSIFVAQTLFGEF
jgi:hypothetical protein